MEESVRGIGREVGLDGVIAVHGDGGVSRIGVGNRAGVAGPVDEVVVGIRGSR